MAKQTNKQAGVAQVTTPAASGGDWDEAAKPDQSSEVATPAAPEKPATTDEVVKSQIDAKTDEDVQRQETPAVDPVKATLKALEAKIDEANDVGKAFDLLKELEAIPATTGLEKNVKRVCIERVKRHCYDIQQGLPLVKMGANELAKEPGLNSASIRDQRLELESRTNADIKGLLDQIAALNKQMTEQKKD